MRAATRGEALLALNGSAAPPAIVAQCDGGARSFSDGKVGGSGVVVWLLVQGEIRPLYRWRRPLLRLPTNDKAGCA